MGKYIIDTDTGICTPYTDTETTGEKLFNLFKSFEGVKEYDGIVATIQKWYYGDLVKSAWCATAVSYFAHRLGLSLKAENVNLLREQCKALKTGSYFSKGNFPSTIKKGDILFWLWDGKSMTNTSKKHVGVCAADTASTAETCPCIGGNQSDSICTAYYDLAKLFAIYRP